MQLKLLLLLLNGIGRHVRKDENSVLILLDPWWQGLGCGHGDGLGCGHGDGLGCGHGDRDWVVAMVTGTGLWPWP